MAALPTLILQRSAPDEVSRCKRVESSDTLVAASPPCEHHDDSASTACVPGVEQVEHRERERDKCGTSWEYPLTRKQTRSRILHIADREIEIADEHAEHCERRARRFCLEAEQLRAENERLREMFAELRPAAAGMLVGGCRRLRQWRRVQRAVLPAKKSALSLKRRWARRVQQRLQRSMQQAKRAAETQAQIKWLQERLRGVLKENERLCSQTAAGFPALLARP